MSEKTEWTEPQIADAYIANVNFVKPHPNADRLEFAYIRNWQCVVGKGEIQKGDTVLFIQPDAFIPATLDGGLTNTWADGVRTYLAGSKHERVKCAKLRGENSFGLIVTLDKLQGDWENNWAVLHPNGEPAPDIKEADVVLLAKVLGIEHYVAPVPQDLNARLSVCRWVWRSPTRTTTRTPCFPSRDAIKALAKFYGEPIAIRGEVCGNGINSNKSNIDSSKPLGFYIYGIRFPENEDFRARMGFWKSGRHFTDVVAKAEELGYNNLKTVPLLGEYVITKELLTAWQNAPRKDGEGIVVNGETFSYKIRSAEYDEHMY
ncbi:unnamed protein product [Cylicocyclus nassatus]|uniref:RNA ligase domain-containing protein n=1 Tax=Cylicocyclus nassatus TaxID=53992 RepID=A0AA36DQY7_CYLNA|nr:unnamed protein product [Cylicocyclus nassatus]